MKNRNVPNVYFQKKQIIQQKVVCEAVCAFIAKRKDIVFSTLRVPDEEERNKEAIDMHCFGEGLELVLEHTRIESFPEQITNGIRLVNLLKPLEESLSNLLPMPGHYNLVVASIAIAGVRNEDKIRLALTKWIKEKAPTLEIGSPATTPRHYIREIPTGVPFEVTLYRWPHMDGRFLFSQYMPDNLKEKRKERIRRAFEDKCPKLKAAKTEDGILSVLVLESNDIALGNHVDIGIAAIEEISLREKDIPDEIYLVETEMKPCVLWVLKEKSYLFPEVINCGPHYLEENQK